MRAVERTGGCSRFCVDWGADWCVGNGGGAECAEACGGRSVLRGGRRDAGDRCATAGRRWRLRCFALRNRGARSRERRQALFDLRHLLLERIDPADQ